MAALTTKFLTLRTTEMFFVTKYLNSPPFDIHTWWNTSNVTEYVLCAILLI